MDATSIYSWDELEFKALEADESGLAHFSGVASSADQDLVQDIIEAGAFGAVSAKRVAMLRDHDHSHVIGKWDNFTQDGNKLVAEGSILTSIPLGMETYQLMKADCLSGLSVGFKVKPGGATYDEKSGIRRITKAHLLEVSVVSVPAHPKARVTAVKSADGGYDEKAFREALADMDFTPDQVDTIVNEGFTALNKAVPEPGSLGDSISPEMYEQMMELAKSLRRK